MLIMAKLHFSYKYHATVKHRGGEKNLQAWGRRKFNGRRGGKLTWKTLKPKEPNKKWVFFASRHPPPFIKKPEHPFSPGDGPLTSPLPKTSNHHSPHFLSSPSQSFPLFPCWGRSAPLPSKNQRSRRSLPLCQKQRPAAPPISCWSLHLLRRGKNQPDRPLYTQTFPFP